MRRGWLYVPGSSPDRFAKAERSGAACVILDLEDAVVLAGKDAARQAVASHLASSSGRSDLPVELWVRINNAPGLREQDLEAVVPLGVAGVCLAKADAASLAAVDAEVTQLEQRTGLADGTTRVMPLIESAVGLVEVDEVARARRVVCLQLGEGDLAADLGVEPGADEQELLYARSRVVTASAAAGLPRPVAPVSVEFRDLDVLRRSSDRLRRLGFGSRAAIHPAQLPVIDECFSPSPEAVDAARRLLRAFDEHVRQGAGAFVGEDGRMVDEAMVRSARHLADAAG